MPRRKFDPNAEFQPISGMARISGFSPGFIRELCKNGKCAFVRCGNEYRIPKDRFLRQMEAEATTNIRKDVTA